MDASTWAGSAAARLDAHLPADIRAALEQRYYAEVERHAALSRVLADPVFLASPSDHVALFADHGVAHVRDVALRTLEVLAQVNGVLIPRREGERRAFMASLGVVLAYVHDIGMAEPGQAARTTHPEFAVQEVLGHAFDGIVTRLRSETGHAVVQRLAGMKPRVLREIMATAMAHSKTKVPASLLADRAGLRRALLLAASADLGWLQGQRDNIRTGGGLAGLTPDDEYRESALLRAGLAGDYADFAGEAFDWLVAGDETLAADVIDTLRVLRAADALRQRGTTLKTSGNHEIFVDRRNASAVFALRLDHERLYLLEIADPTSAGEANLRSSELDRAGHLWISFHHGRFKDEATTGFAVDCAALIVKDIHADTLGSFAGHGAAETARICLEATDDNPGFPEAVRAALARHDAGAAARIVAVPSLAASTPTERARYLDGEAVDWPAERRRALLARLAAFGHRTEFIDPATAFNHVRVIRLAAGDTLVEAGTSAGLVYIPQAPGLRGQPLGGYAAFDVPAFTPVGVTGVVRGAARNATITAQAALDLVAIPRDVYLTHWHHTWDTAAFAALFAGWRAD